MARLVHPRNSQMKGGVVCHCSVVSEVPLRPLRLLCASSTRRRQHLLSPNSHRGFNLLISQEKPLGAAQRHQHPHEITAQGRGSSRAPGLVFGSPCAVLLPLLLKLAQLPAEALVVALKGLLIFCGVTSTDRDPSNVVLVASATFPQSSSLLGFLQLPWAWAAHPRGAKQGRRCLFVLPV